MASSSPSSEIRRLMVHITPGGIKAHDAERATVFYGRRGRPVKKPRFIPAERAHFWARRGSRPAALAPYRWCSRRVLHEPAAGVPAAGFSMPMG